MIHKMVVGLGNPGPTYDATRHNAGFRVLDALGRHADFQPDDTTDATTAELEVEGVRVLLAKPQTFMNDSGKAVAALLAKYGLSRQDLLVIHDDVSLPMGKLRFQRGGSAGGQHGVESLIEKLGGERGFDRLKVAVGPDPGGAKRFEFVLAPIGQDLIPLYEKVLETAADAVRLWLTAGADKAMCRYNGTDLR
jgi:PTH1 family peptidyl-tRNA hydrolase